MTPKQHPGSMVDPSIPSTTPKFSDELFQMLEPDSQEDGCAYYEVEMRRAKHKFHKNLSNHYLWL